jgi:hypothetical protein
MKARVQVFLSYARPDADLVGELYQRLSDIGIKPWMDRRDIVPGEVWKSTILKAIRQSDFFLACLSARSVNKRGVIQEEIKEALEVWRGKLEDDIYLIPVRLEECNMPEALSDFQRVDCYDAAGWELLVRAIREGLERRLDQVLNSLSHPRTMKELGSIVTELDAPYSPFESLAEVTDAIKNFEQASRHVGQYVELNNMRRKRESLNRALSILEVLQDRVLNSENEYAFRLQKITSKWLNLLDSELEAVQATFEVFREILNPFVFGAPIVAQKENLFAGRQEVIREIKHNLQAATGLRMLLLYGPRRMGKSSILTQLPRLLGPDFAACLVDCQNPAVTQSETGLLRYLSRALSNGLNHRRVVVEPLAVSALQGEPLASFEGWLNYVERVMPEEMRLLLCFDEYERLHQAADSARGTLVLDTLQRILHSHRQVLMIFAGVHTFDELGGMWADRFGGARRVRVSFLTRADVELLLTKPIPEFDMAYAAGALDALIAATNCHPFLTQAVAFELVQLLNESQRREATTADVEEAIRRALASGEAYFVNVWGDAGAEGQAILSALASGQKPPEFPAASAWLREHDVVGADGDFAVEMLRRWVASRAAGV